MLIDSLPDNRRTVEQLSIFMKISQYVQTAGICWDDCLHCYLQKIRAQFPKSDLTLSRAQCDASSNI